MDKVKIIVATNKKYKMPTDGMYLPLHVGASINTVDLGYRKDNDGENISELNPYFCELTGLYWAWKNIDAEYIGLSHYRRHFSLHKKSSNQFKNIMAYDELLPLLGEKTIIVPKKRRYYIESLYSHYAHTHNEEHLIITKKIIAEKYSEYIDSFNRVCKQTYGYMFNMMVMRKDILDKYCKWLFDVLFELQDRIGIIKDIPYNQRLYGRVSEILFNVWIDNKISNHEISKNKILEITTIHVEKINWVHKGTIFLLAKFFNKKYSKSF